MIIIIIIIVGHKWNCQKDRSYSMVNLNLGCTCNSHLAVCNNNDVHNYIDDERIALYCSMYTLLEYIFGFIIRHRTIGWPHKICDQPSQFSRHGIPLLNL